MSISNATEGKISSAGRGGDRFYVNKGDLEFVDDGTGAANALRRARAAARFGHAGGREWSEEA